MDFKDYTNREIKSLIKDIENKVDYEKQRAYYADWNYIKGSERFRDELEKELERRKDKYSKIQ